MEQAVVYSKKYKQTNILRKQNRKITKQDNKS